MNNNQKNGQSRRGYTSNFTLVCLLLIAVLTVINIKIFSGIIAKNPEVDIVYNRAEDPAVKEEAKKQAALQKELETSFIELSVSVDDTKAGNLVLVNNSNAYSFEASPKIVPKSPLVPFSGRQSDNYTVSYPAREMMTQEAIDAFNALADDFYAQTGHRDLFMLDSNRSYEDQERVYESKGSDIATLPGHSEHHTGLAFDMQIYQNGAVLAFDGEGDYSWIHQNCHKYGYILRYPHDKTEVTEISYEPWHFRYVGKEHAYYMYTNNLCLEEYIGLLKKYTLDSERLIFTTDEGVQYMIYSQPVGADTDKIYLPKNHSYNISGDNDGNVIVSAILSGN
ncbi:MAG: M15 family metallopeptidase [Clostridia bacterium]|nr:M15 family metallopeptidase [Clostridia bacterium]